MTKNKLSKLSDDALRSRLAELRVEQEATRELYQAASDKLNELYDQVSDIQNELDARTLLTDTSWPLLLNETGSSSKVLYDAAHAKLRASLPKGLEYRVTFSGYHPSIQQRSLTITVNSKPHVQNAIHAVLVDILPHLKSPKETDDGVAAKRIHVMDDTCSENGSLWLAIDEESSTYQLWVTAWHTDRKLYTAKSLKDLIRFVGEKYPYRENRDE